MVYSDVYLVIVPASSLYIHRVRCGAVRRCFIRAQYYTTINTTCDSNKHIKKKCYRSEKIHD